MPLIRRGIMVVLFAGKETGVLIAFISMNYSQSDIFVQGFECIESIMDKTNVIGSK